MQIEGNLMRVKIAFVATLAIFIGQLLNVALAQQSIPLPDQQVISVDNAGEIIELGRLGRGDIVNLQWSPINNTLLAVAMASGIRLYDVTQPDVLPDILLYEGWTLTSLVFSPDGRWIAAGDQTGFVYLWNVQTRQLERSFQSHDSTVRKIVFSPDQTLIASVAGQEVRFWDVQTGELEGSLRHNSEVFSIAFSPDGTQLATTTQDSTLRLWDVTTRQAWSVIYLDGWISELSFVPDGTRLISSGVVTDAGEFNIQIWSITNGEIDANPRALLGLNTSSVNPIGFAISPDGKYLFTTLRNTTIWEIDTGDLVRESLISMSGSYIDLSPDSSTLALAHKGSCVFLQLGRSLSGQSITIPTEIPTPIATPAFQVDVYEPGLTELIKDDATISALKFGDVSQSLYSTYYESRFVYQWNLQNGPLTQIAQSPILFDSYHPCPAEDECNFNALQLHDKNGGGYVNCGAKSAFSPDGLLKAPRCSNENFVRVVDVKSGLELAAFPGFNFQPTSVRFSPDSTQLIYWTLSNDMLAKLWDIKTRQLILSVSSEIPPRFSPDGKLLLVVQDRGSIVLYGAVSGEQLAVLTGHHNVVNKIEFSHDGTLIAAAGYDDRSIHLWGVPAAQ
jgi:WD40 repeat protein